jgi:hypothetical protein
LFHSITVEASGLVLDQLAGAVEQQEGRHATNTVLGGNPAADGIEYTQPDDLEVFGEVSL